MFCHFNFFYCICTDSGNETSPTLSKELYACNNSKAQHLHTQKESQTLTAINEIDKSNAESGKFYGKLDFIGNVFDRKKN